MKKFSVLAILLTLFVIYQPALAEEAAFFATDAPSAEGATTTVRALIAEPIIRVGLSKDLSFTFSASAPYHIYGGKVERGLIPTGVTTTISYSHGRYSIVGDAVEFGSEDYIRLVPDDPASFFALDDYERRFERGRINYNEYRGTLEYRYSAKLKGGYVINELPLEEYLNGIAEVSKDDPAEYVTALVVAARTYAYSHLGTPPSDKHLFDVYGSTNDQLYLGYISEKNHPNVVAAASVTRGQMATYKKNPIMALYFGRSNGKTKSWKGNSRPYLKSVVALYDKRKRRNGHGYGMSMSDARLRAIKDGWTYDEILKYYYTGVEIEKVY